MRMGQSACEYVHPCMASSHLACGLTCELVASRSGLGSEWGMEVGSYGDHLQPASCKIVANTCSFTVPSLIAVRQHFGQGPVSGPQCQAPRAQSAPNMTV